MDELYIYAGSQGDTFFFIHVIANPACKEEYSWQIYNVMMNEARIADPSKIVIIYEFNLIDQTVNAIIIQHTGREGGMITVEKGNIEDFYKALVSVERKEVFVISYQYEMGTYSTFELEMMDFKAVVGKKEELELNDVKYIMCDKAFDADGGSDGSDEWEVGYY
jgi:hypothetical protein